MATHFLLKKCGPKTRRKILGHRKLFIKIWKHFEIVAENCMANGGIIAIEWPSSCYYWHYRQVKRFISKHGLSKVRFDGCMYGLVAQRRGCEGIPMRKSWTVMTNSTELPKQLCKVCDKSHRHVIVMGQDTKRTEGYTPSIVDSIHHAWTAEVAH